MQKQRNFLLNNLDSVPLSKYNSIIKERHFLHTSTNIIDESLPSNVEVNNIIQLYTLLCRSSWIVLASENFYHLSSLYKKNKKDGSKNYFIKISCYKILYNGKWTIGTDKTTNKFETFIFILDFKIPPCSKWCLFSSP